MKSEEGQQLTQSLQETAWSKDRRQETNAWTDGEEDSYTGNVQEEEGR